MKRSMMALMILLHAFPTQAQENLARKAARTLYVSLTGVTPTSSELNMLQEKIENQDFQGAALDIVDQRNGIRNRGAFYNVTVKDMVTPWTTKSRTTLAPLNDMVATIIGYTRDNRPFNRILYEDVVYKANGSVFGGEVWHFKTTNNGSNGYPVDVPGAKAICQRDLSPSDYASGATSKIIYNNPENPNDPNDKKCRVTKFNQTQLANYKQIDALYLPHLDLVIGTNLITQTNEHYESISAQGLDLGDPRLLKATSQLATVHKVTHERAVSGILSSRAYGAAYLVAGTNRAAIAYAMEHFLCKDMEELNDTTIPDFRNRRDVDRSPGGTSSIYKNRCIGCHAGMDALAGAFAYYDFTGKVEYTPNNVVTKMNHNVTFAEGFITQSDQWMNLWVQGQNASLGWGSATVGEGLRSLGVMLSETEAFHSCMAKQVYQKVCNRKVVTTRDKQRVEKLTGIYKSQNFNMKNLFINASIECMED